MKSKLDTSLLYDFYGELLQPSQQRVIELYVNEDMSLSEVADLMCISRQGVRDALSRADRKLVEYETKLGLAEAYRKRRERDDRLRALVDEIKESADCEAIRPQLDMIEELLKGDD